MYLNLMAFTLLQCILVVQDPLYSYREFGYSELGVAWKLLLLPA